LKEGGGGSRKMKIKEKKRGGRKDQALKGAVGICTISNFWNTWNRQGWESNNSGVWLRGAG
jgi:hypothetical protein